MLISLSVFSKFFNNINNRFSQGEKKKKPSYRTTTSTCILKK